MKTQNDPRTQLWIDLNTEISKWMDHRVKIILLGDWNSEALYMKTWMEKNGPTNTILNLHGYSYFLITYQRSKYCPIYGIYCIDPLAENLGWFLSFVILVGGHCALWIDLHASIIICFRQNDIISTMVRNLRL